MEYLIFIRIHCASNQYLGLQAKILIVSSSELFDKILKQLSLLCVERGAGHLQRLGDGSRIDVLEGLHWK